MKPLEWETGRQWMAQYDSHPWSVNQQINWTRWERARHVKEWREAFGWLARVVHIPSLDLAKFTVQTYVAPPHQLHDCGNEFYAAKAAIDGLVDAGVLPDDKPRHMRGITFLPPVRATFNAMSVHVIELTTTMKGTTTP